MADNIGSLVVQITGSTTGLSTALKKSEKDVQGWGGRVVSGIGRSMGKGMGMLGSGLGGLGSLMPGPLGMLGGIGAGALGGIGIGSIVTDSIKLAASLEDSQASFEVFTKDAEVAKSLFADLSDLGAKTPLKTSELADAGKALLAVGTGVDQIVPTLQVLGDLAQGDGVKLNQLATIYGQVKGAGRLMTQDFLQFVNNGVNLGDELANVLQINKAELRSFPEEGKVSFPKFQEAMIAATSGGGLFSGMMEKKSKTLNGLFSTLSDSWDQLRGKLGQAIVEEFGVKDFISRLTGGVDLAKAKVDDLRPLFRELKPIITDIGQAMFDGFKTSTIAAAELADSIKDVAKGLGSIADITGRKGPNWLERNASLGGLADQLVGGLGGDSTDRQGSKYFGWLGPGAAPWLTRNLLGYKSVPGAAGDGESTSKMKKLLSLFDDLESTFFKGGNSMASSTASITESMGKIAAGINDAANSMKVDAETITAAQLKIGKGFMEKLDPVGTMKEKLAEIMHGKELGMFDRGGGTNVAGFHAALADTFRQFAGDFKHEVQFAAAHMKDSVEAVSAISEHQFGMGAMDPQQRAQATFDAMLEEQKASRIANQEIVKFLNKNGLLVKDNKLPNR